MSKPADLRKTPVIPLKLLNEMNPNYWDALLELSKLMTDEVLQLIAVADYGYKEEKCFKLLKEIVRTQELPKELDYNLLECLELTRWSTAGIDVEHKSKAFSCALLLIFGPELGYAAISDENETLASLLESITELETTQKAIPAFLAWRILADYKVELDFYLADEEDKEYIDEITIDPFFIYALLLAMIISEENDTSLKRVLLWNIDMEKDLKNIAPYFLDYRVESMTIEEMAEPFLLAGTGFNQHNHIWKKLSKNALEFLNQSSDEINNPELLQVLSAVVNNKPIKF
ncbi:MAG: hypothetical protein ACI8ZM_000988 [Crocinitomix sp.]|jgi:hypothetical protein